MANNQTLAPVNQTDGKPKRGGPRLGAGRKRNDYDAKWYAARGISPLMAGEILARVADERKVWSRILNSEDDRVVLQAMMYLMSMRDGKPAQSINVTSSNITLNAKDIESARAIIREIRGEAIPELGTSPNLGLSEGSPLQVDDAGAAGIADSGADIAEDEGLALSNSDGLSPAVRPESGPSIMLCGNEGGKKGGVGEG